MMQQHPFWMQQQQQPQFEPQGGAQVRPATPPTPWWRYLQPVSDLRIKLDEHEKYIEGAGR